jgi:hypothetical protein
MKNFYQDMINEMYIEEDQNDMEHLETMRFSTAAHIESVAIIDAIAQRFNTSRASLIKDILRHASKEMFENLGSQDLPSIGKEIDESIHKHCKSVYKDYQHDGEGHYSHLADLIIASREGQKDA